MNVFLAGVIQGSLVEAKIHSQDWREPITSAIEHYLPEADVYCHYNVHPNSITYELLKIRQTFDDGVEQARRCDVLVAWLPEASMGTAIEMYEAYHAGAVVLTISSMRSNWVVRMYSDKLLPGLDAFEQFLASDELDKLVRAKQSTALRVNHS